MSKAEKTRLLNAEVKYFLVMKNYKMGELATKIGISQSTLYEKVADIDRFTYPEIVKLFAILKLDDETKLKLIA